ncbi:aminomethyl transferase family protein [Halobacterium bonnevillei]|uniref:Aminomethyl transferase family protein n=1 Tax=Halobacterium bonnevillei TaxID=2692200 RepID=A0A6B0SHC8_9EURY|nr:aminomethyl transferase family protein [Halobacterium bonnevillei]MXR20467.1 aminomethyl transferase family protein [Halobacterium bonnevillei]
MDTVTPGDSDVITQLRSANRREDFGGRRSGEYTHWIEEQLSWKETCYLGDWSFLANLSLEGPDARDLLADLSINSFDDFAVGQGKHLVQCTEDGYVVADGVLVRDGDDSFVVHGVPAYWTDFNRRSGDYDASATFRDTFNFQVQGPNALAVLDALADHDLRDVDFMHSGTLEIAGTDVRAVRFGMSGELGFELHGPGAAKQEVWDAILDAGEAHGIRRLSVKTSSINQLEAGIATRVRDFISAIFGDDMADYREYLEANAHRDLVTHPIEGSFDADDVEAWYRTPVELGWHYSEFDHDFLGRSALEAEAADPERTFVTLEWNEADVVDVYASLFRDGDTHKYMDMPHQQKRAMVADRVLKDGEDVGVATMRGYSYYFREMLSLCTIDVEHSDPGTEVTVLWGEGSDPTSPTVEDHAQKEVRATVAGRPYKEDRRREDIRSAE